MNLPGLEALLRWQAAPRRYRQPMPIYIKYIRGRAYYYEQWSVYQGPGLPPKTPTRYLGPVDPKRRKGVFAGFIEANFKYEPGAVAAAKGMEQYEKSLREVEKDKPKPAALIDKPLPTVSLQSPSAQPSEESASREDEAVAAPPSDQGGPE